MSWMISTTPALSLRSGYEVQTRIWTVSIGTVAYSPWRGVFSSASLAVSWEGGSAGSRGRVLTVSGGVWARAAATQTAALSSRAIERRMAPPGVDGEGVTVIHRRAPDEPGEIDASSAGSYAARGFPAPTSQHGASRARFRESQARERHGGSGPSGHQQVVRQDPGDREARPRHPRPGVHGPGRPF